jgi:hypothetical protein
MNIKQQVKSLLLKENIKFVNLVELINKNRTDEQKTTISSLNNKLTRGTIKYSELSEIFEVLGYNIILVKEN